MDRIFTSQDLEAFTALPAKEQAELVRRLQAARAVLDAPRGTKGEVSRRYAELLGVHTGTVEAWAFRFKRNGWKALIDHRALPRPVGTRRRSSLPS